MNVLLTGKTGAGKSALIQRVLSEYSRDARGFVTQRIRSPEGERDGVFLFDMRDRARLCTAQNMAGEWNGRRMVSVPQTFETLGVQALTFEGAPELIVMDELGILEEGCQRFQSSVKGCLDAETDVLGVIKAQPGAFLDEIRARSDVHIIRVDEKNRDQAYQEITRLLARST